MHPVIRLGLLSVIAALVLAAFVWPSARLAPRDLPVGVAGPVPAALAAGDAFDVRSYDSAAAARKGVREREVYGALAGRTLFVATGASPAVAATLQQAAPPGTRVLDLAPGTRTDPRAASLGALALPLTLLGILTALLAFFTARRPAERLGLIAGGALAAGVLAALIARTWLDALPGDWAALAGAVALAVAAVAATVAGLAARFGRAGIGAGAALMMLVANPWSGIASAPELLPEPAGAIGRLLPTGAAGDLLRGVAYFDGAGTAGALVVLAAWAVAGLVLVAAPALRRPGVAPSPLPTATP